MEIMGLAKTTAVSAVSMGIEPLKVEGNRKDYLKIKYAGNDLLYVPVEQMDLVQKVYRFGRSCTAAEQIVRRRLEEDEGPGQRRYRKYGGGTGGN